MLEDILSGVGEEENNSWLLICRLVVFSLLPKYIRIMIKKIVLKDIASYDHDGVTFVDLQKVNFIYGGNGTGKITLSRVLTEEMPGVFTLGGDMLKKMRRQKEVRQVNNRIKTPQRAPVYNDDRLREIDQLDISIGYGIINCITIAS